MEQDNEKMTPIYDEIGAMLARCYLHLALQIRDKLDSKWAVDHPREVPDLEHRLTAYAKAAGRYASASTPARRYGWKPWYWSI